MVPSKRKENKRGRGVQKGRTQVEKTAQGLAVSKKKSFAARAYGNGKKETICSPGDRIYAGRKKRKVARDLSRNTRKKKMLW